jgi:predicted phosphoribosyltransferase
MFHNRKDAGIQLANALKEYQNQDVTVLAIPKGGVEVGYYVADQLNAAFDLVIVRKLPLPDNPEAGFGAMAEDGSMFIFDKASFWLDEQMIQRVKEEQMQEVKRRVYLFRQNRPMTDISGKTVILVDDGLAMGSTMRAAIKLCRHQGAQNIIVAVPVTGKDTMMQIDELVDRVIVLETPSLFRAVAQVYQDWYDASDEEVLTLLKKHHAKINMKP